ncbi:MAG TPA: hypothetical protein VFG76_06790 [Candidatus Polarisedimenticolia bacterium]|nr:hypothetical protein [Candidatus Polarisedimenticolia bacterium]
MTAAALILMAVLAGDVEAIAAAPATVEQSACPQRDPATDLLLELDHGDATAQVAAQLLRSYQRERALLCQDLEEKNRTIAAQGRSLLERLSMLDLYSADRDMWKRTAEDLVNRPAVTRSPIFACGPGPYVGLSALDGGGDYGAALACILVVWPR